MLQEQQSGDARERRAAWIAATNQSGLSREAGVPTPARCSRDGVGGRLARRAARIRSRNTRGKADAPWRCGAQRQKSTRKTQAARPTCAPSGTHQEQKCPWQSGRSMAVWSAATKTKDPVVGSTGPSNQVRTQDDRSGRLRCSLLGHALCLRTFLSLNNFEFNVIALLEALISLRLDGTVVDEHIRAVIPADEAEALCVIEPFNFTFNSRHVPYSGAVTGGHSRL